MRVRVAADPCLGSHAHANARVFVPRCHDFPLLPEKSGCLTVYSLDPGWWITVWRDGARVDANRRRGSCPPKPGVRSLNSDPAALQQMTV